MHVNGIRRCWRQLSGGADRTTPLLPLLLNALGLVHLDTEDPASALPCFQRALAIHGAVEDSAAAVAADHVLRLSPTHAALGNVTAAGEHLEEGLAIYGRLPGVDPDEVKRLRVSRWLMLGDMAASRGDLIAARHLFDSGRERVAGAPPALVAALHARLGAVAAGSGDRDEAIDHLETSSRLWVEAGEEDPVLGSRPDGLAGDVSWNGAADARRRSARPQRGGWNGG